ncbi:hypothetical protein AN1V17_33580 [Vallitalea sediminicola]
MCENTIFIGNGINRITNDNKSWQNILCKIISYLHKAGSIEYKDKPFTLLYEEIFLRGLRFREVSEKELKSVIAKEILNMKPNNYHEELYNLPVKNIITTNYDYTLERNKNQKKEIKPLTTTGKKPQTRYRINTYNNEQNKKIWHIHGEAKNPDTLVLGHEKYSNVLKKIMEHVSNYNVNSPSSNNSWIDLFYNTNVHILGFGYDYTEIDLWWLINNRARSKYKEEINITNKLIYYIPKINNTISDKEQKKLQLLNYHDVDIEEIGCSSFKDFYNKSLIKIKKTLDNIIEI